MEWDYDTKRISEKVNLIKLSANSLPATSVWPGTHKNWTKLLTSPFLKVLNRRKLEMISIKSFSYLWEFNCS